MDNQTDSNWLVGYNPSEMGTGIFLVSDAGGWQYDRLIRVPSSTGGTLIKLLKSGMRYDDCAQEGQYAIAFKWVPERIMTYGALSSSAMACGGRCSPRCADPACMCEKGFCR